MTTHELAARAINPDKPLLNRITALGKVENVPFRETQWH